MLIHAIVKVCNSEPHIMVAQKEESDNQRELSSEDCECMYTKKGNLFKRYLFISEWTKVVDRLQHCRSILFSILNYNDVSIKFHHPIYDKRVYRRAHIQIVKPSEEISNL